MLSTTAEAGDSAICLLRSIAMTAAPTETAGEPTLTVGRPALADGVAMWRLAAQTGVLDVNSRYAYLIWCRDFAATSVVARLDEQVVGFVTGYRRPDAPEVLLVWQVAVGAAARGRGVAGRMLDTLWDQVPDVRYMETTVTPDNAASIAMFTAFARRRETEIRRADLFAAELLGDGHEPEDLYRIGPIPNEGNRDRK
jgi:L-2,4-diaminobutyric acid acetyltransferase